MARIHIDNPIKSEFSMVPNCLWQWPGLSFKAKGFFAYLLSHRDGSCPPVAAMERDTGLGRDARKAAMAELIAARLARWVIERDRAGRVLAKRLEVTTRPLLAAVAAGAVHAPENPSHGVHAPEKPSDGKTGGKVGETRRCPPENPAILQNETIERNGFSGSCRGNGTAAALPDDVPSDLSMFPELGGTVHPARWRLMVRQAQRGEPVELPDGAKPMTAQEFMHRTGRGVVSQRHGAAIA